MRHARVECRSPFRRWWILQHATLMDDQLTPFSSGWDASIRASMHFNLYCIDSSHIFFEATVQVPLILGIVNLPNQQTPGS